MKPKVCAAALFLLLVPGCNLNKSQVRVVAKNSGLASAVTWIAYDNPSQTEIEALLDVLRQVENLTLATSGENTYGEILFPIIEDSVEDMVDNGTVEKNQKPLILAGSLAIANGIDLLFASNQEWGKKGKDAGEIVSSFIEGAIYGLSLSDNDPRMVRARQSNTERSRVLKK